MQDGKTCHGEGNPTASLSPSFSSPGCSSFPGRRGYQPDPSPPPTSRREELTSLTALPGAVPGHRNTGANRVLSPGSANAACYGQAGEPGVIPFPAASPGLRTPPLAAGKPQRLPGPAARPGRGRAQSRVPAPAPTGSAACGVGATLTFFFFFLQSKATVGLVNSRTRCQPGRARCHCRRSSLPPAVSPRASRA